MTLATRPPPLALRPLGEARPLFEVTRDVSFFNCASMAPLLRASVAAITAAARARARPWEISAADWFSPPDDRRAAFAAVLGADPDCIALIPSASYGIETAARNLPLRPGDEILTLHEDFPSSVNTWRRHAAESGADLIVAHRRPDQTWTESLLGAIGPRTRVVSAPAVYWLDGARLDLGAIGAAARATGAALVVDATQAAGATPIDIAGAQPDFLVCAGYKWLLGPYGLSYLYVAPRHHRGRPLEENWISRDGVQDFARLAERLDDYRPGARRFDAGEQAGFELGRAAAVGLEQLASWGVDSVAARLGAISDRIADCAAELGLKVSAARERAPHIISLDLGEAAVQATDMLTEARVIATRRGRLLRIAPHLHVDEIDLHRLTAGLQRLAGERSARA